MRKSIIVLAALALGSGSALAADYSEPAPEAFTWTGFYAGLFASYNDVSREIDLPAGAPPFNFDADYSGFSGGGLVGFNYQFDSIVVGIEGDIAFASIDGSSGISGTPFSLHDEIDTTYGVRARLGYAIDRTLLFVTGGAAWADFEATLGGVVIGLPDNTLVDETLFGWQFGGGVEHAVADNITVRLEYLYTDYEDEKSSNPFAPAFDNLDYDLESHSLRLGVNFLLNSL